jgi:hypothetical protein
MALCLIWSAGALELGAQQPTVPARETPGAAALIERLRQIQEDLRAAGVPEAAPGAQTDMQLSADQVRRMLNEDLGVEVLTVEPLANSGRSAYAVKVMNPPGDYNAAFMVITLLVDGDTGEILGEARATPGPQSPDVLPEARRPPGDGSGLELRRRTYR